MSTIVIGAGPGGLAAAAALKLRGEEVVALERAHSVGSTCARVDLSQRVGVRRKTCPGGGNGQHWRRDRHRPA
ncbi:NAD(P)-binding protein [Enemella dayhoffiae]|uniref:NAD(P)-binding protein n=1 Tax=Enemella dayhoffiae TaxID=2016507 RepID=UPI0038993C4F